MQYIENIQAEQEKEDSKCLAREQRENEMANGREAVEKKNKCYSNLCFCPRNPVVQQEVE